ncbi:UNVERIFIED_CONTAM: hypothetical protein HDU68_001164 [Siphonaria sp. JEL0065]|nr:hypothetical protein HDU68_001164 [Siphonaria sp. JEL0065]
MLGNKLATFAASYEVSTRSSPDAIVGFLTTLTSNTIGFKNASVLASYEQEMRFTVERIYKQFLAISFEDPSSTMNVTCSNCTIRQVHWVKDKDAFMVMMGGMNLIAAVMVLVSIILSCVYKDLQLKEVLRSIDILALELDGSLAEKNAEFKSRVVTRNVEVGKIGDGNASVVDRFDLSA